MGEFRFSFSVENNVGTSYSKQDRCADALCDQTENAKTLQPKPAQELRGQPNPALSHDCRQVSINFGGVKLCYLSPDDIETSIKSRKTDEMLAVQKAINEHSDLIPCVYEGGLKVWECSLDLIHFLQEENISFLHRSVLELGCGAGLPGIYAMKQGAVVHFQDYNEEVLNLMTVPNVLLNSEGGVIPADSRFFSGDWGQLQRTLQKEALQYDIILTAETIYSVDSQPRLYDVIKTVLRESGKVYLAAKTHYFGVGGGTRQFEEYVRGRGEFNIKSCKVILKGVQREILEMTFSSGKKRYAKT